MSREGVTSQSDVEALLRELAPQVLGVLTRRYGDFDAAEDAVQEALLAAATHWPRDGILGGVEVAVPAREHAEDLRRELA